MVVLKSSVTIGAALPPVREISDLLHLPQSIVSVIIVKWKKLGVTTTLAQKWWTMQTQLKGQPTTKARSA